MSDRSADHPDTPRRYEIRISGHLDPRWATWFDGMTLTTTSDGTTVLDGAVVDQAALHGVLRTLRDTGLPLLSVTRSTPHRTLPTHTVETDMTTTVRATATPMDPTRRTALVAGTLYLVTFVASIPAALYFLTPVLENPDYIISAGADTRVLWAVCSTWSTPSPPSAPPSRSSPSSSARTKPWRWGSSPPACSKPPSS